MIAVMALFVILRSYSSLALEAGDILGIALTAIGTSLVLGKNPGTGAYTALAVLCAWYGNDYEAGYLILKPIAFYLAAMGTLIDVVLASLGTWAVAKLEGYQEEKEAMDDQVLIGWGAVEPRIETAVGDQVVVQTGEEE